MPLDLSNFEREGKIRSSRVRDIFTPNKPISDAEFFAGRTNELVRLLSQFDTPGLYSLLYGERGVGKSSLANVFGFMASTLINSKYWKISCDSSTTFEDILKDPLKEIDIDITIQHVNTTDGTEIGVKAKGKLRGLFADVSAEGGVSGKKEVVTVCEGPYKHISPSFVAENLGDHSGLLIIDEADRLVHPIDKQLLAELIKQLSDRDSKFKILIVGVAETGGELIENHESISRCLGEIKLPRMTNEELELIITKGADKLFLSFDNKLITKFSN